MNGVGADSLAAALVAGLDDDALDALAERLAPRIEARLGRSRVPATDAERWMTTAEAADYLGMTTNALHKLTAARAIPFSQDGPGCRCYFKRSELDSWRAGASSGMVRRRFHVASMPGK